MSWSRRTLLAVVMMLGAVAAGCGFHLRGQATYNFKSIYVNAPGSPAIAAELRRALAGAGSATVADDPKDAQVILDVPLLVDNKDVLSLFTGGRVREFALEK